MSDEDPMEMRPAPPTLSQFFDMCGGTHVVAKVSGKKPTWISRLRKTGKWRGSRPILELLSELYRVHYREEWLDEIQPAIRAPKKSNAVSSRDCTA